MITLIPHQHALSPAAPTIALDVAGARCNGRRTPQWSAQGAVDSESAASRDIPCGRCARIARRRRWLGRAKRRTNDLNPLASEHFVKPVGEFLIAVANQKPQRFRALGHGPRQLPSLL